MKFALLWFGYLNFHPFLNLVFLAFLLFPLRAEGLHRARNIIAIPIGIALFYHDTWLPGVNSILSQGSQVAGFSAAYLLELVNRFINWQMVGAGFVLLVAYLFLAQWIRIAVFTVAAIAWLNVLTLGGARDCIAAIIIGGFRDFRPFRRGGRTRGGGVAAD